MFLFLKNSFYPQLTVKDKDALILYDYTSLS